MNRETSIYLDLVRFSASMLVMFAHLSGQRFTDGLLWQLSTFQDDAVIVFFVLSGFVIAHVVSRRETSPSQYIVARIARIYSVALPALVITFLLDALGRSLAPELYSESWGYIEGNEVLRFLAGTFFLNQLWYAPVPIGSMLPYWSLGFEVWYYVFFGVAYFCTPRVRGLLLLLMFLIAGPRIVLLFPIWLMGYAAYRYSIRGQIPAAIGLSALLTSLIGYLLYQLQLKDWLIQVDVLASMTGVDYFLQRYVVGMLFSLHLIGFCWLSPHLGSCLTKLERPIRWLAGATFTIYLLHLPVAQFMTALIPWEPAEWQTRALMLIATPIAMFLLAEITERKKEWWAHLIAAIYGKARSFLRVVPKA